MDYFSWIFFGGLILFLLGIDLFIFNRKAHTIQIKEALLQSAFWIGLALLFNLGVFIKMGSLAGTQFLAAFLMEKSLSVDNLFVFILIFTYFKIPSQYQHRILFWGILGALLMRAIFIAAGISLIHHFEWIIYLFGAFLIYTGFKLAKGEEKEIKPEHNPIINFFKKILPVSNGFHDGKFFIREKGLLMATPLFIALLMVESTDVMFAVDSIPAVLAISNDPFIVYTSNIFAILGLRALYFALSGVMQMFVYLNYGLAFLLSYIGVKMLISHYIKIPIFISLGIIFVTLCLAIFLSLKFPPKKK